MPTDATQPVRIRSGRVELDGDLELPPEPIGTVIFAHGSGSSRHSPRNKAVAAELRRHRLATLLMDLLTPEEEEEERYTRHHRFDIDLLSGRLVDATSFVRTHAPIGDLPVGYFGASTGAAAALRAAAGLGDEVAAVVSRGGRPDLAGDALPRVLAPSLLVVGSRDVTVLELNRQAQAAMKAPTRLEVIPDATHLFPEPGALARVAELAADWFVRHLGSGPPDGNQPS